MRVQGSVRFRLRWSREEFTQDVQFLRKRRWAGSRLKQGYWISIRHSFFLFSALPYVRASVLKPPKP